MRRNELYFDTIADDFDKRINLYDLKSRIDWFEEALNTYSLENKNVLEIGAGLGYFSYVIASLGGNVTALDISLKLAKNLKRSFPHSVCASALWIPFSDNTFDMIVSSECIEHTRRPKKAVIEMIRVLKPKGTLFLTTPNLVWKWAVSASELLKIRRFAGLENWLSRRSVRNLLEQNGMKILVDTGLYIVPFQVTFLQSLITLFNRKVQFLKPIMINQCWVATKK